jgi:hypothetical protein
VYRTPIKKIPKTSKTSEYRAASLRADGPSLPHGLDVWASGRRVLNVEWDDQGSVAAVVLRPGSWEADLIRMSEGKGGRRAALRSKAVPTLLPVVDGRQGSSPIQVIGSKIDEPRLPAGWEIRDDEMSTGCPVVGWEGVSDRTTVRIQLHYTKGRFSYRLARMLPLVFTPDQARAFAARLAFLADASERAPVAE